MIFHIARASDWDDAVRTGHYAMSTVDRTLDEEGFIHASFRPQLEGVVDRHYGDVDGPLVLLAIDPERLTSELRVEAPPGRDEGYPHIYGPLNATAVVESTPMARDESGRLIVPG
ncbi:MAG: DUF952 domain-containing protein [Acidimicrobiales bacterium]